MKSSRVRYLAVVLLGMGWLLYALFHTKKPLTLRARAVLLLHKDPQDPSPFSLSYKPAFHLHPTSSAFTVQNDCERAYHQMEDFCSQEEQIWACEFLIQEDRLSAQEREHWRQYFLALLQQACDTHNDRKACMEFYKYKSDDLLERTWAQQKLQTFCEANEDLEVCDALVALSPDEQKEAFQRTQDKIRRNACYNKQDKYACWQMIAAGRDEQNQANASTQYQNILLTKCDLENDDSACWELYAAGKEPSLQSHSLERFLTLNQENCFQKNDLGACWSFYNHSPAEEKARNQEQILARIQEACEVKGDVYACWLGYLDKTDGSTDDSGEKQKSLSPLVKLCTDQNNVEACSLVVAYWSPASPEYQQVIQKYAPLNIRACIEGSTNACQRIAWFPYSPSDGKGGAPSLSAQEEQALLTLAEAHCNSATPEVCKILIRLYKEAGQCT